MAIDSVRLLTDSAAQIWRGLRNYGTIESLFVSDCFDDWFGASDTRPQLNQAEEQLLRRDYRRLLNMLSEIETLVRSRPNTLELVRTRIAEDQPTKMVKPKE